MQDLQNGIFLTRSGGLTPASFLGLIGMPLLLSGSLAWGGCILFIAFILAVRAAMETIREEDKQEIRYNILDAEDIIAELELLEEELSSSPPSSSDQKVIITIRQTGRAKCCASLSAMVKKYRKQDRAKNIPLLCQQAAYLTLRLYPEDNEAVGGSIALLALVAKDEQVRQRNKFQADVYGLNKPIHALHLALERAKKEEDEEKEGEIAEILRKGCLFLGALSDDDKDFGLATAIVEEEGLELILDIANWFRYHEDIANWAMWAIFILCYDQLQNKIQFVRLAGITTILGLLEYNQSSLEVNRHCIAILYDLLREGNNAEGKQYDHWTVRRQALASGLHNRVVKAMSEFSDSMDIMMMGQEMLIGTGYCGDIPQFQPM